MARDKMLELFVFVCRKPMMYVQCVRFTAVAAYMDGFDSAHQGGALVGFREWLLTGSKAWTNLPWWSLLRLRHNPAADLSQPPSCEEDQALIGALLNALEGFSNAIRESGLAGIFYSYNSWLLAQTDPATKDLRDRIRGKT